MKPIFRAGRNMAMKVPTHKYESTVKFYRDILGLRQISDNQSGTTESVRFEFGDKILWIDRIAGISHAEIWLEIVTDDVDKAADYLELHHCVRCDEIEPLPDGFKGFWLSNPANIIHLVASRDDL